MKLIFKLKLKFLEYNNDSSQEDATTNILRSIMSLKFWHSYSFLLTYSISELEKSLAFITSNIVTQYSTNQIKQIRGEPDFLNLGHFLLTVPINLSSKELCEYLRLDQEHVKVKGQ